MNGKDETEVFFSRKLLRNVVEDGVDEVKDVATEGYQAQKSQFLSQTKDSPSTEIVRSPAITLYDIALLHTQSLPLSEIKVPGALVPLDDLVHALSEQAWIIREILADGEMRFG